MKLLLFADLHTPCISKIKSIDFIKENYDACFTLGDINTETLQAIQNSVNCSIYTVLGNHDEFQTLSELNVQTIDRKIIEVCGLTFVGLSGSSRYKEGNWQIIISSATK